MVDAGKGRRKLRASASAKHRATYRSPDNSDWVTRLHWRCKPGLSTIADAVATLLANLPSGAAPDAYESLPSSASDGRFRGWHTNKEMSYRRMTDEIAKLIIVKVNGRPDDEAVARLKQAGFCYRPEYFGQEKVWTRSNDFSGCKFVGEFEAQLVPINRARTRRESARFFVGVKIISRPERSEPFVRTVVEVYG
jgi:hypothetical protein